MKSFGPSVVVGVFESADRAERCVEGLLREAGFAADQIGIIEPDEAARDDTQTGKQGPSTIGRGAAAGAVIGGLLGVATAFMIPGAGPFLAGGVLASELFGLGIGMTAGKVIGALAGLGMTEREATFYERQLEQGKTVVTINVAGRYEEAEEALRRGGAVTIDSTGSGTERYATASGTEQQEPSPGGNPE
jgi:hypothetical protein